MFAINDNMFLGAGDLKAYGGSKHGQVLRKIERDDWHGSSFSDEYSFLQLQDIIEVDGRKGKLLHVVLVPKGYIYEEGAEHYKEIGIDSATAMAQTKRALIESKSI